MRTVIPVAYLELCPCGRHGRIVNKEDSYGPEVCTKEEARDSLRVAIQLKAVSRSEVAEVLRQIVDSSLADNIDEVPFLTRLFVEVSNSSCPDDSNLIDLSEGTLPEKVQKDEVIH